MGGPVRGVRTGRGLTFSARRGVTYSDPVHLTLRNKRPDTPGNLVFPHTLDV